MKRVAILINHPTAAKFFADVFNHLGYETYIPLKCSIERIFEDDKVLQTRKCVSLGEKKTTELDTYDFYRDNSQVERIKSLLQANFNVIITYHVINSALNRALVSSGCSEDTPPPVYFTVWGDITNDPMFHYKRLNLYDQIKASPQAHFAICHRFLFDYIEDHPKNIYLPIGLTSDFSDARVGNFPPRLPVDNILIIISRLSNPFFGNTLLKIHTLIGDLPQVHFTICGHFNPILNYSNVTMVNPDDQLIVYDLMRKHSLAISFSPSSQIIQYSPIELAACGCSFLYTRDSRVATLMEPNDKFIFTGDTRSLIYKIKQLLKNPERNPAIDGLYDKYKFTTLLPVWKSHFQA